LSSSLCLHQPVSSSPASFTTRPSLVVKVVPPPPHHPIMLPPTTGPSSLPQPSTIAAVVDISTDQNFNLDTFHVVIALINPPPPPTPPLASGTNFVSNLDTKSLTDSGSLKKEQRGMLSGPTTRAARPEVPHRPSKWVGRRPSRQVTWRNLWKIGCPP
jgi:hypothetical protein